MANSVDLTEFALRLTPEIADEYRCILEPYGLAEHTNHLAGGRLMRSRLAAVSAGVISDRLVRRCVALELLHTSTLVLDDILDNGTVRRGLPTLWKSVGLERALLVGNLIATRALAIVNADSAGLTIEFLEAFRRANQAQLRESHEGGRIKSMETHVAINIGKTSALLELGLVVGCWSNPRWPVDLTHLREAVREFGIGLQLADDVEDIEAWLGEPEAARSKKADFDVELGNFTMPRHVARRARRRRSDRRVDELAESAGDRAGGLGTLPGGHAAHCFGSSRPCPMAHGQGRGGQRRVRAGAPGHRLAAPVDRFLANKGLGYDAERIHARTDRPLIQGRPSSTSVRAWVSCGREHRS
jgi:geranylgeranyl pyrophosphate synthase